MKNTIIGVAICFLMGVTVAFVPTLAGVLVHRAAASDPYPLSAMNFSAPPACPGTLDTCAAGRIEGAMCVVAGASSVATKLCICSNSNGAGAFVWCKINLAAAGVVVCVSGTSTVCAP